MLASDFEFELPGRLIAQEAPPRGTSRLFVLEAEGAERHRRIGDLPRLLRPGDLLVVNDTRVIPARLFARRPTGGRVELLLVERHAADEWSCLAKPGRRARPGTTLRLAGGPEVRVLRRQGDGRHRVRFSEAIDDYLRHHGHVPLPPYIKRPDRPEDRDRYQTVYATAEGAIAAPTAGLHFTEELLSEIARRGVEITALTLHVGIGTFKPVTAELVHEHVMDAERYEVPAATADRIAAAKAKGRRVVAVGTTVVRTLEGVARDHRGIVTTGSGSVDLFIQPGFSFQIVDALLTNFHLPRSTLLMLVCGLAGRERVLAAYREAVERGYRFYSYGDAMLLERRQGDA